METQPGVVEALGQTVSMVTCGDSFTTAVTKSKQLFYKYRPFLCHCKSGVEQDPKYP